MKRVKKIEFKPNAHFLNYVKFLIFLILTSEKCDNTLTENLFTGIVFSLYFSGLILLNSCIYQLRILNYKAL